MESKVQVQEQAAQLLADTRGAGLVEYIILVGLIALSAIAGFRAFGTSVNTKATDLGSQVTAINPT